MYKVKSIKAGENTIPAEGIKTVKDLGDKIKEITGTDKELKIIFSGKVLDPETDITTIGYKEEFYFVYIEMKPKTVSLEQPKIEIVPEHFPEGDIEEQTEEEFEDEHNEPNQNTSLFGSQSSESQPPTELLNLIKQSTYASMFIELFNQTETPDSLIEILDNKEVRDELLKDIKIRHTLLSLSTLLRKKVLEKNEKIKSVSENHPEEYKEVVEDPDMIRKGQDALAKLQQLSGLMPGMGGNLPMPGMGQQLNPSYQQQPQLELSEEDKENIDEIVMITGKSKMEVEEIYFACDKNKELTVNMLFN
jgi:hypothetical protein